MLKVGEGREASLEDKYIMSVHNCSDKVHMHTIDLNTKMAFSIIVP